MYTWCVGLCASWINEWMLLNELNVNGCIAVDLWIFIYVSVALRVYLLQPLAMLHSTHTCRFQYHTYIIYSGDVIDCIIKSTLCEYYRPYIVYDQFISWYRTNFGWFPIKYQRNMLICWQLMNKLTNNSMPCCCLFKSFCTYPVSYSIWTRSNDANISYKAFFPLKRWYQKK